jgi:hypothetical protein
LRGGSDSTFRRGGYWFGNRRALERSLLFREGEFFGRGEGLESIQEGLQRVGHGLGAGEAFGRRAMKSPVEHLGENRGKAGIALGQAGSPATVFGGNPGGGVAGDTEINQAGQGEEIGTGPRAQAGLLLGRKELVILAPVEAVGFSRAGDRGREGGKTKVHKFGTEGFIAEEEASVAQLKGLLEFLGLESVRKPDPPRVDSSVDQR